MPRTAALVCCAALASGAAAFVPAGVPRGAAHLASRAAPQRAHTIDGVDVEGEIVPLANYVLVSVKEANAVTTGGVLLPDQAQEKPTEGDVVSTGPGKTHPDTGVQIDMPVAAGDSVLYGQYDGTPVEYDGRDHTLIRDDDVLLTYSGGAISLDGLKLLGDRLLLKPATTDKETASGIVLSASAAKAVKVNTGEVLAVGPGVRSPSNELIPNGVVTGEFVKFRDYGGVEIRVGDDDLIVVKQADCLAKWAA